MAITDENILNGKFLHMTIWQEMAGSVPEPALALRDYSDNLITIRQGNSEILINKETVLELCRVLKKLAANRPKEN